MKSESYWLAGANASAFPKLSSDLRVDVLVVGGGITGVTAALLIRETGKSVALVEKHTFGGAETGHTTAHLTYMTDTRLSALVSTFGEEAALASWDAGSHAMEQIHILAKKHDIECERRIVPGYLACATTDTTPAQQEETLQREAQLAQKHGFDVTYRHAVPPTNKAGILFANQAKFHPIKYLRGLVVQAAQSGVQIYENTNVDSFEDKPARAVVGDYSISYEQVVIATHMPLQGTLGTMSSALFQTKLYAYSTYALQAVAPSGSLPEIIWSDTAEPFNYLRVDRRPEQDVIVYGGKDHKTGQEPHTERCYEELTRDLLALVPSASVQHRWSGQVIETADGLPYIGEIADGLFLATGFSGNGLTFGTLAAMMAADYVAGTQNPWTGLFDPHRKAFSCAWTYAKENASYPYYMAKDWANGAEVTDANEISCGQGRLLRHKGSRVAAYRDKDGTLSLMSPVCPHLGCIVHWNDSEQTWDCPCHGSRFAGDGSLMAGPAESNLKPLDS